MADNDQNDEYKFDELDNFDNFDNNALENPEYKPGDNKPSEQKPSPQKDVRRNALIAVGILVFAAVMYKLIGGFFSGKTTPKDDIPEVPLAQMQSLPTVPSQPAVVTQPVPSVVSENTEELKQKVDAIESSQMNVQSQVSSVNEQVGTVNNNINSLSAQISRLNQTISDLTMQLNKQSEEITILMERTKPKPVRRRAPHRHTGQANNYYINAVIPGRAWLIGTNGSTLTVREGTKISGYGVVKLIDSMEGRVLTSSGRIIRFSQDDS